MEFLLLYGTYVLPIRKRTARTRQSAVTAGPAATAGAAAAAAAAAVVAAGISTAKAGRPAGAAGVLDPAVAALRTKAARTWHRVGTGLYPPVPAAGILFLKTDNFPAIFNVAFKIKRSLKSRSKNGIFEKAQKKLVFFKNPYLKKTSFYI